MCWNSFKFFLGVRNVHYNCFASLYFTFLYFSFQHSRLECDTFHWLRTLYFCFGFFLHCSFLFFQPDFSNARNFGRENVGWTNDLPSSFDVWLLDQAEFSTKSIYVVINTFDSGRYLWWHIVYIFLLWQCQRCELDILCYSTGIIQSVERERNQIRCRRFSLSKIENKNLIFYFVHWNKIDSVCQFCCLLFRSLWLHYCESSWRQSTTIKSTTTTTTKKANNNQQNAAFFPAIQSISNIKSIKIIETLWLCYSFGLSNILAVRFSCWFVVFMWFFTWKSHNWIRMKHINFSVSMGNFF